MNRRKKGLTFGHYCIFFYIFIRQVRFLTIFAQFFVFVKCTQRKNNGFVPTEN